MFGWLWNGYFGRICCLPIQKKEKESKITGIRLKYYKDLIGEQNEMLQNQSAEMEFFLRNDYLQSAVFLFLISLNVERDLVSHCCHLEMSEGLSLGFPDPCNLKHHTIPQTTITHTPPTYMLQAHPGQAPTLTHTHTPSTGGTPNIHTLGYHKIKPILSEGVCSADTETDKGCLIQHDTQKDLHSL